MRTPLLMLTLLLVRLSLRCSDLRDIFHDYGTIIRCEVVKDPYTKASRGFGFVSYTEPAHAEKAQREQDG
jgi:transformer-2 protein